MLKILIIDDEKSGREIISHFLIKHYENTTIVSEAESVNSGLEAILIFKPDIVILDIQLKDGTGFNLLKKVETIDFKVVFITAYQEFAIKAFEFSAIDYILKPVTAKQLIAAINKAEAFIERENINLKINTLLNNVFSTSRETKKIILKTAERIYAVDIKDVIRCEADGSYTRFYLNDGKKILVSRLLKEFDTILNGTPFIRIHNSHLINFEYFDYFEKAEDLVIMKDKSSVPVAARRKEYLLKLIGEM